MTHAEPVGPVQAQPIAADDDVVRVRQLVRAAAVATKLSLVDQTKLVTAASELARNTLVYGGGGQAEVQPVTNGRRSGIRVVFTDDGPGHRRPRPGAHRRLHHRRRPRPRAVRRPPAGGRVRARHRRSAQGTRSPRSSGSDDRDRADAPTTGSGCRVERRRPSAGARPPGRGRARRARLGLPDARLGDLAIVATELATQPGPSTPTTGSAAAAPVRRTATRPASSWSRSTAGPGMADVTASSRDGHSTAGTLGIGLGAIAPAWPTEFDVVLAARRRHRAGRARSGPADRAGAAWAAGICPADGRRGGQRRRLRRPRRRTAGAR